MYEIVQVILLHTLSMKKTITLNRSLTSLIHDQFTLNSLQHLKG